jgi:hypothetical protein
LAGAALNAFPFAMSMTTEILTWVAALGMLAPVVQIHAQTTQPSPVGTEDGLVQDTSENGLMAYRLI